MPGDNVRVKMPSSLAKERIKTFDEVNLGLSNEDAVREARRCLLCKNPLCRTGCPISVKIPDFISEVAKEDFHKAVEVMNSSSDLPAICGRVCAQENLCEKMCVLGKKSKPIAIGALERFVGDYKIKNPSLRNYKCESIVMKSHNVAIVGSGPGGLVCAAQLARNGFGVTIFESLHSPGGVLGYGIPPFRLDRRVLNSELDYLSRLGVKIELNTLVGRTITFDDIWDRGFEAIFLAVGAGLPRFLNIEGEALGDVYSANEFLTRVNLLGANKFPEYKTPVRVGERVVVVGGGNTAMDSARTAIRLGASNVTVVYRRGLDEMPARVEEIEHAKEEGVGFKFLTNPTRIIGNPDFGVEKIECVKMTLGESDQSGRKKPISVKDSEFFIDCDTVVIAVGLSANPLICRIYPQLKTTKDGEIVVDENFMSSMDGVFAGGDIIGGEGTVVSAMGDGKKAAMGIMKYLGY